MDGIKVFMDAMVSAQTRTIPRLLTFPTSLIISFSRCGRNKPWHIRRNRPGLETGLLHVKFMLVFKILRRIIVIEVTVSLQYFLHFPKAIHVVWIVRSCKFQRPLSLVCSLFLPTEAEMLGRWDFPIPDAVQCLQGVSSNFFGVSWFH